MISYFHFSFIHILVFLRNKSIIERGELLRWNQSNIVEYRHFWIFHLVQIKCTCYFAVTIQNDIEYRVYQGNVSDFICTIFSVGYNDNYCFLLYKVCSKHHNVLFGWLFDICWLITCLKNCYKVTKNENFQEFFSSIFF